MKLGDIIPYKTKQLLRSKYKLKKKTYRDTKYPVKIEEPITKEMTQKFRQIRRDRDDREI